MNNKNDNLGFGIRVDDMFPGAWSFGISLSHSMDETYVFINLFKKTIVVGWIYKEYNYEIEQEPLYYAKVKGSELIRHDFNKPYWTLEIDDLFISFNGDIDNDEYHTRMTKEEWNEVGINNTNADFEKVE